MGNSEFEKKLVASARTAEKRLANIENILRDLSMKLCHVIKYRKLEINGDRE